MKILTTTLLALSIGLGAAGTAGAQQYNPYNPYNTYNPNGNYNQYPNNGQCNNRYRGDGDNDRDDRGNRDRDDRNRQNGNCGNAVVRGTIVGVNGDMITLARQNNRTIAIDDQPALNRQMTGRVAIGRFVTAYGFWRNGEFFATRLV